MFKSKRRPSDILLSYLDGTGRELELDDYVHSNLSDYEKQVIVDPLMDINREFSCVEYPVGIDNPDAGPQLRRLAEKLKHQGM
jgi:hypothetical protein